MANLSLRIKLVIIALVPMVLLIIIGAVGIVNANNVDAKFSIIADETLPFVTLVDEIKFTGSRLISSTNELILDATLEEQGEAEAGDESVEVIEQIETMSILLQTYNTLVERDHSDDLVDYETLETTARQMVDLASQISFDELDVEGAELAELREEFEETEVVFLNAVNTVLVHEREELAQDDTDVEASVSNFNALTVAIAFVAVVVAFVVGSIIYRSITRPLAQLQVAADRFGLGDYSQRTNIHSKDEVGQFAATFDIMGESIQELVKALEDQVNASETARLRAERSDQVKSSFLASMSHELRTPLNSIINFTQYVVDGDTGPVNETQQELLNEVVGSGKHLLNLINDVLDMSKIEAGSLNLFVEKEVSVSALLNKTVTTARSLLAGKPVRVQTDIAENLPPMMADRQRILQILLNIISNATKFTEEGEITVNAKQSGDEIVISIQDTGVGIAPKDQPLVFEAFKQTDSGLRQAGGTGLGMPIAKSLTEAHGGRLWFESELNKGSTFYVALPIHAGVLVPTMA